MSLLAEISKNMRLFWSSPSLIKEKTPPKDSTVALIDSVRAANVRRPHQLLTPPAAIWHIMRKPESCPVPRRLPLSRRQRGAPRLREAPRPHRPPPPGPATLSSSTSAPSISVPSAAELRLCLPPVPCATAGPAGGGGGCRAPRRSCQSSRRCFTRGSAAAARGAWRWWRCRRT